MKKLSVCFLFLFFAARSFAQTFNVKAGNWSNPTVWSNSRIPGTNDDVILNFDIIVDINATCQSLTLNGHNATVNAGINFVVSGNESTSRLSAYVQLDTTLAAPSDTVSKTLFYYDNAKRNTGIDLIFYENGLPRNYQFKSTFFYNGTDTLPFKRIVTTPFLANTDPDFVLDTCFYFYTNGILNTDSSIDHSFSNPHTTVDRYVYFNGGIINTSTDYGYNPSTVYTWNDTIYINIQVKIS